MAAAQQQNQIALPPLQVPFNRVWGHEEILRINREIEKVQAKIDDVRPRMIRLKPQNEARKQFLIARRAQIMKALGL